MAILRGTGTVDDGGSVVRRRPRLVLTNGTVAVISHTALLGSAPEAGIVVDDRAVSRVHAELEPRSDGLWVKDLGSKNGTYIDEVRVQLGRVPPAGGRLRVGNTTLAVQYDAPEPVELWQDQSFGPLIGRTAVMRELFGRLAKIAPTEAAVLIQGETGTGKELVARAPHDASRRASGPTAISRAW